MRRLRSATATAALDSPARFEELRRVIASKPALRALYQEVYLRYRAVLARCPADGLAIELGSGAGFVNDVLPEVRTTDVVAYPSVDQVVDATKMPWPDCSVRALFMLNVFHHVPDVGRLLQEAERVLTPGGRVLIVDQHCGWLSSLILRHLHHERFDPAARQWRFDSTGPLSDANGALAWIVFRRDRHLLAQVAPQLVLVAYRPHTPLRYWLSGGLKSWSLLPRSLFGLATALDEALARWLPSSSSFVDIELVKRAPTPATSEDVCPCRAKDTP